MKIIVLAIALIISSHASAAIKCERDGRGNMCCWDTDKDGPFRPLVC